MRLVVADISAAALESLAGELATDEVLTRVTDVASYDSVHSLADAAYEHYGQVDLLFNNAGILLSGFCWQRSLADWQRIMGVNFWGVLHGIKAFVPRMIEQGNEGHIVNTASLAGLLISPLMGPYAVSKQAVVALAETLHYELAMIESPLRTSVLCPGPVVTGIASADEDSDLVPPNSPQKALQDFLTAGIAAGISPAQCADIVFSAVREEAFWIFTHQDFKDSYRARVDTVFSNSNPLYQPYQTSE
jgi:NADP-dependent 3-hydroxy acid dehydrogenase YdfG